MFWSVELSLNNQFDIKLLICGPASQMMYLVTQTRPWCITRVVSINTTAVGGSSEDPGHEERWDKSLKFLLPEGIVQLLAEAL